MFEISVITEEFKGLTIVKQHRLVNEVRRNFDYFNYILDPHILNKGVKPHDVWRFKDTCIVFKCPS